MLQLFLFSEVKNAFELSLLEQKYYFSPLTQTGTGQKQNKKNNNK